MSYLVLLAVFLVLHAYLWLRARPYREAASPAEYTNATPKLSFLVPAWNAAADISEFVSAFHAVRYPDKELLLCAGGADRSLEIAQSYAGPQIRVLEQRAGEGKQGALMACFAASCGEIIYLTDIDCRPDTKSVLQVLEPILSGQEAVVTGSSVPLETQRSIAAVLAHWAVVRKAAGLKPRYIDGLLGRNCAVTREAVEAIGGFRYDALTGTDYRMAQELHRRGFRIWLEPRSEVQTAFAWPFGSYVRKRGRWLRNVILYAERPRQRTELRGAAIVLATPFGLLFLLASTALLQHPLPAFLALLLLLHGVLNRLRYAREALRSRYLRPALVFGSALNLLGTLAAGVYAAVTLLNPSLRKQW